MTEAWLTQNRQHPVTDLMVATNRHIRQWHSKIPALLLLTVGICCSNAVMAAEAAFHLNIGFSSQTFVNAPKEDIRVAVRILSAKVAEKSSGSADSRIYDTQADMERDLRAHKLDILALTPKDFLDLRSRVPLDPVMVTASDKGYQVDLLLLVRKDSRFHRLKDLQNKNIVIPSKIAQNGNLYHIWLDTILARYGFPAIDSFFSSTWEARTASQALMRVFFRTADACVVTGYVLDLAAELNPQIANDLRVIARTDNLAGGIIALRNDLPAPQKQRIRQALSTLHEDQEGHQLFVLFQLDRLIPYRPEYLKATEVFVAEYHNSRNVAGRHRR